MAPMKRNEVFQFRVTPEEKAMLQAVADAEGLNAADILRVFIRARYAERYGDKKPPKPKK